VPESNVEIVRRLLEAGTSEHPERALELLAPEVKWYGTVGGLYEGRVYEGHVAVIKGYQESFGAWEDMTLEVEELIPVGDSVLVYWHEIARFQDSDATIEARTAGIYTVADGQVVEVRTFLDRAKAREALGLED
jgi:ketosteroid isomerase-like protein